MGSLLRTSNCVNPIITDILHGDSYKGALQGVANLLPSVRVHERDTIALQQGSGMPRCPREQKVLKRPESWYLLMTPESRKEGGVALSVSGNSVVIPEGWQEEQSISARMRWGNKENYSPPAGEFLP